MGHPDTLSPLGDAYRLEKHSAIFIWAVMALAAAAGFAFKPAAFAILPLALVFTRLNPYRFLILWIAATLFFSETFRSTFLFLAGADVLVLAFFFLLLAFELPKGLTFRVPINAPLFFLYALVLYSLALAPYGIASYKLPGVLFDVKVTLLMAFVAMLLALDASAREPKKVFLVLGAVIAFSSLHSLEVIAGYLISGGERPMTWTGIFMSSSVLFCVILLRLPLSRATAWSLRAALAVCVLGVLFTQTRGLWFGTVAGLAFIFLQALIRRRDRLRFMLRFALIGAAGFLAANFAFLLATGGSAMSFFTRRAADMNIYGLVDPYSSIGYRLHESWAVWDERTLLGHGPGAPINLFFTQAEKSVFMDWWSIHSGYFEILHKYGFVGVVLMGCMALALFRRAGCLTRMPNAWMSAGGLAVQVLLINHAVYSITSNEFNRSSSPLMWFLAFYVTMKLTPRHGAGGKQAAPEGRASAS